MDNVETPNYEVKELQAKGESLFVFEYSKPLDSAEQGKLNSFLDKIQSGLKDEGLGEIGDLVKQWKQQWMYRYKKCVIVA